VSTVGARWMLGFGNGSPRSQSSPWRRVGHEYLRDVRWSVIGRQQFPVTFHRSGVRQVPRPRPPQPTHDAARTVPFWPTRSTGLAAERFPNHRLLFAVFLGHSCVRTVIPTVPNPISSETIFPRAAAPAQRGGQDPGLPDTCSTIPCQRCTRRPASYLATLCRPRFVSPPGIYWAHGPDFCQPTPAAGCGRRKLLRLASYCSTLPPT